LRTAFQTGRKYCLSAGNDKSADELTGKQRRESLQNNSEKRKHEGTFSKEEIVNHSQ